MAFEEKKYLDYAGLKKYDVLIKELINNSSKKDECNAKVNKEVSINGVIVKDGTGQAILVDTSNPRQVLFKKL